MFFMIVGCYHTFISIMEGKIMKTVKVLLALTTAAALLAGCGAKLIQILSDLQVN